MTGRAAQDRRKPAEDTGIAEGRTVAPGAGTHRHALTPWARARAVAAQAGRVRQQTPPFHEVDAVEVPDLAGPNGFGASGRSRPSDRVPLDEALGRVTAAPLVALTDLPPFDTSAMDGWAVAGPGPWLVRDEEPNPLPGHGSDPLQDGASARDLWADRDLCTGTVHAPHPTGHHDCGHDHGTGHRDGAQGGDGDRPRTSDPAGPRHTDHSAVPPPTTDAGSPRTLLAGCALPALLGDGYAVRIATGARIPHDATAVIRSEHGHTDRGRLYATRAVVHGQDIRPRGQECRRGDLLLPPGVVVTPAVLGLAAAAGYDTLVTVPLPRVEVLVLGDELLTAGLPHDGLIRDALGPMLPPWLRALGAEVTAVRRLGDDARALHRALTKSDADLLVTTGGTAAGPVDHVHPTLHKIGAELLVDGVAVRPGHPMLLARTGEHQHLVGLPGNPLAAVSGLLTLAEPLIRALRGLADTDHPDSAEPAQHSDHGTRPCTAVVTDDVQGHPYDTRLVPVVVQGEEAMPLHYNGPAMLRGVAAATALAVVEPGGAVAGERLEILELPWAASVSGTRATWPGFSNGACFT